MLPPLIDASIIACFFMGDFFLLCGVLKRFIMLEAARYR